MPYRKSTIRLIVISDLHCRLDTDSKDSLLTVGGLRRPMANHPVESLLTLIKKEKLSASVVLVPGDLSNKACREGLSQGWDFALEVGRAVKADYVIPVLGNHDVDSRRHFNADPCHFARSLRGGFPFASDRACDAFFAQGSCILKLGNDAQLIAINSVIDHQDEQSAVRGAFDDRRVESLERLCRKELRAPIRIAMMHHHPLLHSGNFFNDTDVISTGDAILSILKKVGCHLVIHGHKHHARLRYDNGMVVFAAGSFSALLQEYASSTGNMFHVINVETQQSLELPIRGEIKTWQFQLGNGWVIANQKYSGFPFVTGFGRVGSLDEIAASLMSLAKSNGKRHTFTSDEILNTVPELKYLTPLEFEDVSNRVRDNGLKFWNYAEGEFSLGREVS